MALSVSRDKLALERTRLANERTFLAYVRTSLSLLAGGALIVQFFSNQPYYLITAWVLFVLGGIVLFIGIFRFIRVKGQLDDDT